MYPYLTLSRTLAAHDNDPRNKASEFALQGALSKSDAETLCCLTRGSDFIEDQEFSLLHKIVLGLSSRDLEEQIVLHKDQANVVDGMGRTPLIWAAAREDKKAVSILLSFGADPNVMDIQLTGPVSYAADRGHAVCVRLLLEAGANPDPPMPDGLKIGTPLNCAARNASDPLVLKNLLDFSANIKSSGADGMTSLHQVARTDNASFALTLLEYGANVNATTLVGETPLTITITYNSYNLLQLLLDRWFEYSACPRLKGPHLLRTVASYADLKTMSILTTTDHSKLEFDRQRWANDLVKRLEERSEVDEKLLLAFDDLLSVIKVEPEPKRSSEVSLESGLVVGSDENAGKELDSEKYGDSGSC